MVALLPILVCNFTSVAAKVIKFMFINSWRYTGYDSFSINSQSSASVSRLALCPIVAAWFQLTSRDVKKRFGWAHWAHVWNTLGTHLRCFSDGGRIRKCKKVRHARHAPVLTTLYWIPHQLIPRHQERRKRGRMLCEILPYRTCIIQIPIRTFRRWKMLYHSQYITRLDTVAYIFVLYPVIVE